VADIISKRFRALFKSEQFPEPKKILKVSDERLRAVGAKGMKKVVSAENLGKEFAKVANTKGIKEIVFDRNGYKFHGRIKAFAESVRASGLKF
jgi:large subunit ribosomal protein L18